MSKCGAKLWCAPATVANDAAATSAAKLRIDGMFAPSFVWASIGPVESRFTDEGTTMRVQIAACVLSAALVACSDDVQTSPAQAPGQTAEVTVVYEAGPHVAQCAAPAVSLAQSTVKLTQAGIQALRSSCGGIAGVAYPAVCGAPTGEILVHNIPTASLAAAKAAG